MTYRGLFCLDHLYVVMLSIIFFWKVFCNNILYSLSFRPVTSTHFPDHLRTLAFQIIFWSPRYTMRLDIRHKIFANVMQNLTQDVAYFQKKTVCFSSMVFFPALFFCLFPFKCSDVHLFSLQLIPYWNMKMMYWKRWNSVRCIFIKSYE